MVITQIFRSQYFMFGIGVQELIIIAVIALLIVGPKKLPDLAKTLGKGLRDFQKATEGITEDIKQTVQSDETPKNNASQEKPLITHDQKETKADQPDETSNNKS
jgi:sec-independent protein translocase protein TatA